MCIDHVHLHRQKQNFFTSVVTNLYPQLHPPDVPIGLYLTGTYTIPHEIMGGFTHAQTIDTTNLGGKVCLWDISKVLQPSPSAKTTWHSNFTIAIFSLHYAYLFAFALLVLQGIYCALVALSWYKTNPPALIFHVEAEIYGPLELIFLKHKDRLWNIWTPHKSKHSWKIWIPGTLIKNSIWSQLVYKSQE